MYTINTLYSTYDYDVILGTITHINNNDNINTSFKIGDNVIVIPNYYTFKICLKDPFMSICVSEECIFKIKNNISDISGNILPSIKCGCIANIINILNTENKKIIIYSEYNIYKLITQFINNIEWLDINDNINNSADIINNNNIVYITQSMWFININNIKYCFDLQKNSLIYIFGKNIISNIINKNIVADIYCIPFKCIIDLYYNNSKKSRFFYVLSFS